jgi:hypothetical protein
MQFEITTKVHFGYLREPGICDDLTDADIANLSAPRPGLPNGYGRAVPAPVRVEAKSPAPAQPEPEAPAPVDAEVVTEASSDLPQEQNPPPADDENEAHERALRVQAIGGVVIPPDVTVTAFREPQEAGSDDQTQRPADPEQGPFPCRSEGCVKGPFSSRVGRDTHERSKHGKVLS